MTMRTTTGIRLLLCYTSEFKGSAAKTQQALENIRDGTADNSAATRNYALEPLQIFH